MNAIFNIYEAIVKLNVSLKLFSTSHRIIEMKRCNRRNKIDKHLFKTILNLTGFVQHIKLNNSLPYHKFPGKNTKLYPN